MRHQIMAACVAIVVAAAPSFAEEIRVELDRDRLPLGRFQALLHLRQLLFHLQALVLLFQPHPLHLVRGSEALVQLGTVAQVAQLHLRKRAALARFDVVHFDCGPKAAIMFQNVPDADFVAVNLCHGEMCPKDVERLKIG